MFEVLGIPADSSNYSSRICSAFRFGAPPHGGSLWAWIVS
jgi:hypothetical protein